MTRLLMIVPAPVNRLPDGLLRLDVKFVEGMREHVRLWDGPVDVVLWDHGGKIPFGAEYQPETLGFGLHVLSPDERIPEALLTEAGVVFASADMVEALDLPERTSAPVVYSIEYTIGTRLKIVALDRGLSVMRKAWSILWNLRVERHRRRAFRRAAGVQANGYPAFAEYKALNSRTMLYLDGRMRPDMMADGTDTAAKIGFVAGEGPLRLVHSGRLEPMKGAQDLVPIARALQSEEVDFTLDIFGDGSLKSGISAALSEFKGKVRLHDPVDFETALVPWMRRNADIFLSCHRQSDPSCTYLESMGCGVPVIGYDNEMWKALQAESHGGWVVPMGQIQILVEELGRLSVERDEVLKASAAALKFAKEHDFEAEFSKRMQHLASCVRPG